MPGVIMENGSRNGSHTNHDRDQRPNGVNGVDYGSEKLQEKGKGRAEPLQNMTPTSPTIPNGLVTFKEGLQHQNGGGSLDSLNMQERVNQLPPEIAHITENYQSLQSLLSRLAQKTHNDLTAKILELAQMPVPASAVNGNASHITTVDDNSVENNSKKKRLLDFLENAHADWAKALIITIWSRRADGVSKIVDLKEHIKTQSGLYGKVILDLAHMKIGLIQARLPNPDLKTALEVLTTGKASWMPELDYIPPTPLTSKEVLKTLENIDTILSMRLNLDDYDSIPSQFRDYTIKDGRVTFKVAGEFEVDLTVADENPESQYWFIDLRFLFKPSLSVLNPRVRNPINYRVDEILKQDGLAGCYKHLHEMILTHKVSEFKRQAIDLARGKWAETLKVEALNRALSIQYWVDRFPKGIKSWVILGVHSGRRKDGRPDPKATSKLSIRWFRDGKEVKDVDISFDSINISTESLLRTVIAKHVSHLMAALHETIRAKPLYTARELALTLSISPTEPTESELKIQLTSKQLLSIKIEPITGRFVFSPASGRISAYETALNYQCPNPATEGHTLLDKLRYALVEEDFTSSGLTVGWIRTRGPGIRQDVLKERLHKDTVQVLWFRRQGWVKDWHLAVSLGMFGEHWQLFETADDPDPVAQTAPRNPAQLNLKIVSHVKIPIKVASPAPTYQFLSTLNIFASALLSHYSNLRALHSRRALHTLRRGKLSSSVSLPSIYVRLSELLPSKNKSARTGKPWAKDIIKITFKGIELLQAKPKEISPSDPAQNQISQTPVATQQSALTGLPSPTLEEIAVLISEARMIVPIPNALANINEKVDRDIAFNPESGSFSFRLRSKIGESVINNLIERTVRVERLVEFVQVLQKHENVLKCETVSLGKIVFTYGSPPPAPDAMDLDIASDRYKAVVDFSAVENNMQLVLERGNPHLQIADLLTKVLNGTEGLDGVATLLPLTLPVLRALDTIVASWTSSPFCERADVFNNVRAADWYIIRYNINKTSPQGSAQPQVRKIMFEVRMRQRRGAPWWHIRRTDKARSKEVDDLDEALKPLWADKGRGWLGMRTSAVAEAHGAEELIGKVDDVVRKLVTSEAAVAAPPIVQAPAPAPAPVQNQARAPAPAQQQQRQQQPTPNQSQNQSQGRNATVKREVVEID